MPSRRAFLKTAAALPLLAALPGLPATEPSVTDINWIITIKKSLVPTLKVYRFSDPKFIGKRYSLHDVSIDGPF